MGCGESKNAVATGNTITSIKKSNSGDTIPEKVTDIDDNNTNSPPVQEQESEKAAATATADVKDIGENITELKEGEDAVELKKEKVKKEEDEVGRLISRDSPNHYFSSRKDDHEAIGSLVLEEKRGDVVEEKELVEEAKAEVDNGEPANVKEEYLVKEEAAAATTTVEEQISTAAVDAGEEHATDSSTKDPKTI